MSEFALVLASLSGIETPLHTLLNNIQSLLMSIGGVVCVIGIIVGGLMRATAFGSERRIAASNVALSCAVVGFIIILLAPAVQTALSGLMVPTQTP